MTIDITPFKGKKTSRKSKTYIVRLNEEAYKKLKTVAVTCECTLSSAITKHLHLTK